MNALIMPPRLVHLALFPVTTSLLSGFVTISTPLPVVVIVTASVKSWKNCVALEQRQHRYLRTGVCAVFLIRFYVTLTHAFASLVVLLSAFFPRANFVLQEKQWKAQLRVSLLLPVGSFAHNMWIPLMELLFHGQISGVFVLLVDEIDLANIALSCDFALDLLCYKEGAHSSA